MLTLFSYPDLFGGFIANIYFYEIDTPLKRFVVSQPNLVAHCRALHG
jgi:hypothetical protein